MKRIFSLLVLIGHMNVKMHHPVWKTLNKLGPRAVSSAHTLSVSLCRTQAEMAHTCRGTINLATAHIDTEDACNIVLSSGGRTYHLKASTEVERQRWVTALELAKAKAIRMMNDQSGESGWSKQTLFNSFNSLLLHALCTLIGREGKRIRHPMRRCCQSLVVRSHWLLK